MKLVATLPNHWQMLCGSTRCGNKNVLSGASPATWRSAFLIEDWSGGGGEPLETPTYKGIRTDTHKYVEYDTGEKDLYDLSFDPYELQSFPEGTNPALLDSFSSRLESLRLYRADVS